MILVLTTTPTPEEAEGLAGKLINERLAACVQIMPQMTSLYVWEGEVQREAEHLLLIKTLPEKWDALRDFIAANHSYSVPEIVAIEADNVSGPYLDWMKQLLA